MSLPALHQTNPGGTAILASEGQRETEFLSPLERAEGFSDFWYELATADHFWMKWRAAACERQLRDLGVTTNARWRGLEIGCGVGVVQKQIAGFTSWTIDGCELNLAALASHRGSSGRLMFYDVFDRLEELQEEYDFLVLFDVLEHIAGTQSFLEAAISHLKPGGLVLVNVPALSVLYSDYDRVVGHLRRYSMTGLTVELQEAGLEVRDRRYWGFSLVPLLLVRKAVLKLRRDSREVVRLGFSPPGRLVNKLLCAWMRLEILALGRPWLGTSIMAAAVKPAAAG